MLKVQQQALFHNTNQQLLSIRQAEIDYYTNYFNTFGFLAVLLVGFTIGSLTQVLSMLADVQRWIKMWYWVSCTCTVGFGIQCMVNTSMISVFGIGLAVKGPLGSMARAVNGMKEEEAAIFNSFILTVISFACQITATFWLVMFHKEATVSSVVMGIAAILWYRSCTASYNRFSFIAPDNGATSEYAGMVDNEWRNVVGPEDDEQYYIEAPSNKQGIFEESTTCREGYMALFVPLKINAAEGNWTRYYFVFVPSKSGGGLWYYPTRLDFERTPDLPVKSRAIELDAFNAVLPTATSDKFQIDLVPTKAAHNSGRTKVFSMRCDTLSEVQRWEKLLNGK